MAALANQKTLQAVCRVDFATFAKKSFSALHPLTEFQDNWHMGGLAYRLQLVSEGKTRLLSIEMPPRSMKSLMCSVMFPVWLIGKNPGMTVVTAHRNKDLAVDLSNKSRKLMADPFVQSVFPTFKSLSKDTETEINTKAGGGRIAFWVDGGVTGRGGDVLIMDDLLDASDADNEHACQHVNHWHDDVFSTRKNQPATTPVINVMQRLSVFDLGQHLRNKTGWEVLSLPAIATADENIPIGGGKIHHRKKGDLLHEARYPAHYLEEQQQNMGYRAFQAQFQQCPVLEGAGVVDLSEFERYDTVPKGWDCQFVSVDPASGSDSGAYTAFVFGVICNGRLYITLVVRRRMDIADQLQFLKSMDDQYRLDHMVIENAGPGKSLLELINRVFKEDRHIAKFPYFVQMITPTRSKVERMEAELMHVRSGRVLLPKDAPWLPTFESELRSFPAGRYNDQVDALSQAIKFYNFYENHPMHQK